jgi:hypothetical protein
LALGEAPVEAAKAGADTIIVPAKKDGFDQVFSWRRGRRFARGMPVYWNGRTARPFNPLSREDRTLFDVLLAGEHALHGFTNRDLRSKLGRTPFPLAKEPDKQPGQVTRLLRRLHAYGLIAKVPRSRRWRVSLGGRRLMASAIKLREVAFPNLFAQAA